ncbi:MAG TPA: protein kinase [Longimicrobiales bacterium]|nr:protein kinase [Longimicrobiales bacterium]
MSQDPIEQLNAALVGRYHIDRKLGEGGMATVYLADDLRHERKVALKVLKPELAAVVGADRFLAEIKTTANLQHPHILPLFDSGEADSFLFYVMPYIEGETLRDRLDRERQLPIDEALGIATAVANALQTAHEAGVVHRDIKPANILLSRGEPLVADFGIAIAVGAASGNRLTETGLSVGTPYYMSPEQATGDQVIGAASDIFALACVLYEMLVGEPPYPGSTAQAVLGKIIQGVPVSATAVRKSIPANVDAAIRKALEKIPADRFTGAQQFAKALADPAFRHGEGPAGKATAVSGKWRRIGVGALALCGLLAAAVVALLLRPTPPTPVERFSLAPLQGQGTDYVFDVSDDGSFIVLNLTRDGVSRLYARRMDALEPVPISGTERGVFPAISPDGAEVAFLADGSLKVAPIRGGVVRTLADSIYCCVRWSEPDFLTFGSTDGGVRRVPAQGGSADVLVTPVPGDQYADADVDTDHDLAVFTVWGDPYRVEALRLSTGERKVVTPGVKPFLVGDDRYLVFSTIEGQILAGRFDSKTMELEGAAVPVVDGVRVDGDDYPYYSVAPNGTLVYWIGPSTAGADGRVVRVDRSGQVVPVDPSWQFNPGTPEVALALSPDGERLAVKISGSDGDDIWVKQLDAGPLSRLTFDKATDRRPRWSRDGKNIIYTSDRKGENGHYDLWTQPADGTGSPEVFLDLEGSILEVQVTPDESAYLLRVGGLSNVFGVRDLINLKKGETEFTAIAAEPYDEKGVALSPDGRWVAYESTETGRDEIYVRPYPDAQSGKWQVSTTGGINPKWAHNGRELFFVSADGEMVAAEVNTAGSAFQVTSWKPLFNIRQRNLDALANYASWDVDVDDQHFFMIQFGGSEQEDQRNEFVLVQNWLEEVRARLGR